MEAQSSINRQTTTWPKPKGILIEGLRRPVARLALDRFVHSVKQERWFSQMSGYELTFWPVVIGTDLEKQWKVYRRFKVIESKPNDTRTLEQKCNHAAGWVSQLPTRKQLLEVAKAKGHEGLGVNIFCTFLAQPMGSTVFHRYQLGVEKKDFKNTSVPLKLLCTDKRFFKKDDHIGMSGLMTEYQWVFEESAPKRALFDKESLFSVPSAKLFKATLLKLLSGSPF